MRTQDNTVYQIVSASVYRRKPELPLPVSSQNRSHSPLYPELCKLQCRICFDPSLIAWYVRLRDQNS